jgi:hypothetical protein
MRRRLALCAVALAALLVLLAAAPVVAHALHGNVDAPLPFVAYILGAAAAVALSFAFVGISDGTPMPEPEPGRIRTLWRPFRWLLRLVGLTAWIWVVAQTITGGSSDAEVGSLLLWVFGWVGLALLSALLGPVWAWLDPFSTLHDILAAIIRPTGIRIPGRSPWHRHTGVWPAVAFMVFLVWLELVARVGGGRDLGLVLIGYTLLTLGGMAWYGKERWRSAGEVFSVWFGLLGRLAPWGLLGSSEKGRVQRRGFGSALGRGPWSISLLVVVAVATGSVIWDGVSQTQLYYDMVGERHFITQSLLLLGFLAGLAALVVLVARRVGFTAMGAGLVPVVVGYLVAHYLTYLLTEGQRIVVALSDPLQQGWDLLGTVQFEPREDWLASSLVWTLQVTAVVIGHVVGAWLGHSAVRRERAEGQTVSQWPLAALMIGMTVVALWSLGQNLVFVSEVVPTLLPEALPEVLPAGLTEAPPTVLPDASPGA